VAASTPAPTAPASPADTPSPSPTSTTTPSDVTGPPPGSLGPPPAGDPVPSSSTVVYLNGPATVQVYGAPDAARRTSSLPGHNSIDQPSAFLALDQQAGWFHVLLPVKPNGSTGWLKASDVQVATTNDYLRVTVSQFRIDHYVGGKWQAGFRVAVGKPATPTPTGLFYILASQQVNQAPYTPGIFALSGFAPQPIPGFLGATLGVHGWTDPSVIGTRASNGCVRLRSRDMDPLLRTLILGTPVAIVA
jgi:lipoprotein-anchoring transpeptidase ErfK/SrfK